MSDLKKQFADYKSKKIALFGLGTETRKVVELLDEGFNIIGLLDGFRVDGFLYGRPIINIKQCVNGAVDVIVVVARPGSCRAIAKRIGGFCRENEIELIDIRGNDLLNETQNYFDYKSVTDLLQALAHNNTSTHAVLKINMFQERLEQIQKGEKRLSISDAYDIGYLFCAPIIVDFIIWFRKKVREKKLTNVWFCARDGYLLKELYEMVEKEYDCKYFLTSRIAAIRSCVEDEEDLLYVDSMKFSGTLEKNLKERFGIDADKATVNENKEGILRYGTSILDKARRLKIGYQKYMGSLEIQNGDIALFDFVAKGTTQYFISRLTDKHMVGLYFLQLEPDFMKDKNLDIIPFYTDEELESSAIFDNYYVLETILTCPNPSVAEFDENGIPVYLKETRTAEAVDCIKRVQLGIKHFMKKYMEQCDDLENSVDKVLDEKFLKLIHNFEIKDENFLQLVVEDPFFNRMTNITDVL